MLVLRRKEGQWIEVTHRSGDVLRFRVYDIQPPGTRGGPAGAHLAFDDDARNFDIQRPERAKRCEPTISPDPTSAPATSTESDLP